MFQLSAKKSIRQIRKDLPGVHIIFAQYPWAMMKYCKKGDVMSHQQWLKHKSKHHLYGQGLIIIWEYGQFVGSKVNQNK